jgi:YVTN family beta-propeller protein
MKATVFALCLGLLLAGVAMGQYLEKVLYLPDSAGGVLTPTVIACNQVGDRVYVGGSTRGVSVLDAESGLRLYRIETARGISAICHDPVRNRVYIASGGTDSLFVADGANGHVLGAVAVGRNPIAIVCHPSGDRVYVACAGSAEPDSTVYEVDCPADTVRAVHVVGLQPYALCYDPANNMLYSADLGSNTVSAINCSGDSDVVHIPVGLEPRALACDPVDHKVYCMNSDDSTVTIIDGADNHVRATVLVGSYPRALCFDSLAGHVFCAMPGSVAVIGGAEDSVIATIPLDATVLQLDLDPDSNLVYCLAYYPAGVTVIDAATNQVVDSIRLNQYASAMCFARGSRSLFVADADRAAVAQVGCDSLGLKRWTRVGVEAEMLIANPSGTKLYCMGGYPAESVNVSVIDPTQCAVTRAIEVPGGGRPVASCYNSAEDKLYYAGFGAEVVVIDSRDSVIARIPMPDDVYGLVYAVAENKVYVGGGYFDGFIAAIDGQGDSIVSTVAIPDGGGVYNVCYNPGHNTVYGFGNQRAVFTVLDCAADTVVGQFPGGTCPGASLYNALSDKVYMVGYVSGTMQIIDGGTNVVLDTVDVGNGARDMCLNTANNKVYGSSTTMHVLAVVDGAGDSLIAKLTFPGFTRCVAYDPDWNIVYCGYVYTNTCAVALVDGTTERIVGRISIVAGSLTAITAVPEADRVFVADPGNSCVEVIRTGAGAVSERGPLDVLPVAGGATIVRGVLVLGAVGSTQYTGHRAELLDAMGRKVLDLKPGANDVRSLATGVYFVREASGVKRESSSVRKLVLTD